MIVYIIDKIYIIVVDVVIEKRFGLVVDYFYFFCKFSGEKKFSSTAKIVPEQNNVTTEEGKKLDIFGIKTISSTREGRNNYFLHCNFDLTTKVDVFT